MAMTDLTPKAVLGDLAELINIGDDMDDSKDLNRNKNCGLKDDQSLWFELAHSVLMDNIPLQVWFLTDEVHYGSVNAAHARFIGKDKSSIEGRNLYEMFPEEEADACAQSNRAVFKSQAPVVTEQWITGAERDLRLLKIYKTPYRDRLSGQTYLACYAEDITEQRQMEALRSEFLSTAAHELRTPLTSIMGFAELLKTRRQLSPEKQGRYSSHILAQSKVLKSIIDNYLNVSRIESGRGLTLEAGRENLGALIHEVVKRFQDQGVERRFSCRIEDAPCLVLDRMKFMQVLYNILSNAIKYSGAASEIIVKGTTGNENSYLLSIIDHGQGMTREEQKRVFDKYYRGKRARCQAKGLGLGMAVAKYLVTLHQGSLWLESEIGKGTTVYIELPCENRGQGVA